VFAFRERAARQGLASSVSLLADEAAATGVQEQFARALADGCTQRAYQRALAHSNAIHRNARFTNLQLTALPTPRPGSYPAGAPYRASAERVSLLAILRTRRGLAVRRHFYEEAFVLAYKRALVVLTISSTPEPLPTTNRNYLESVLAGRAQARWGISG
jgi:hypothetical protein